MYELQIAETVLFVLVGLALPGVAMIGLAMVIEKFFGHHSQSLIKNQSYECGMTPEHDAYLQFDIRYYLYALLFIVFDIEVVFILPWALTLNWMRDTLKSLWLSPIEMTIFLGIMVVGLAYAWKKGALEWE